MYQGSTGPLAVIMGPLHLQYNYWYFHSVWKSQKILASFWKTEACGQRVLPNRSFFIGQKLMENAKVEKYKWDIMSDFQTLWWLRYDPDSGWLILAFLGPKGIAVNRSGHLVVVDNRASCIFVFQPNGKLVQKFGCRGSEPGKLAGPHFVAIDSQDHIIVSDFHNHSIKVSSTQK